MEFGITCWGASKNKKIKNIQNIQKKKGYRSSFKFKLQYTYNSTFWKTKYFETA